MAAPIGDTIDAAQNCSGHLGKMVGAIYRVDRYLITHARFCDAIDQTISSGERPGKAESIAQRVSAIGISVGRGAYDALRSPGA